MNTNPYIPPQTGNANSIPSAQVPPANAVPQTPQMQTPLQPQFAQTPPMYMAPGNYAAYGENPEEKRTRAVLFEALFLPTLLYALLYTFFLYKNFSSITMPLFVITTVVYCFYCLKKVGINRKAGSYFYFAIMFLLAISSATTGSTPIIVINTIGIFLLLVCMLLHNFHEDTHWTFGKYFTSIFMAIFGAIGSIGDPFCDVSSYQKRNKNKRHTQALYILIGICVAIPLLTIIVLLLYYADAVFAQFIRDLLEMLNPATIAGILLTFLFAWFSAYCGFRFLGKRQITDECKDHQNFEPLIAITILAMVSVVYLFFSVIQILYLFWGKMQLPDSYTYAAYAREGFFQLLFVCILNVAIVLFVLAFFRKNIALNILLAIISCCTYIMLASSAFRMYLYVQNYNLTFLRILVLWGLVLIALLLVGILIQIFWKKFPLFQYGLVVVCLCYLALSFSHPDYWIAKYNLAHMENMSAANMDYRYLENLSSDAAPVIAKYEGSWVENYTYHLAQDTNDSIRQFNFSHAYARSLFKDALATKEDSFYLVLRNESVNRISDVTCHVSIDDDVIRTIDAEPIGDTDSGLQKFESYICLNDFTDSAKSKNIGLTFDFTDNEGNTVQSRDYSFTPEPGKTYVLTLTGGYDYDDDGIRETYYLYKEQEY